MGDLEHNAAGSSHRPARRFVVVLAVLGAALVLAPVAMGMFSKAPAGAEMLTEFTPLMSAERLDGFSGHLDTIDAAVSELDAAGTPATNPEYAAFSTQWPVIDDDMSGLMDQVTDNLGNYQAMASLPSFRLFPWFFLVPGALVALVALVSLALGRWTRAAQVSVAAVGLGLVAIPLAFGMFSKGPKGGEMMNAFRDLETSENVARIQGYFSQMAVGQGSIRLQVVPALEKGGLSAAEVAREYPATTRLNEQWVPILIDMTPMIGAMSDNVDNYDAIRSMPPFSLFGWAFLVPGLIVVGLAVAAGPPRPLVPARPVTRGEPS